MFVLTVVARRLFVWPTVRGCELNSLRPDCARGVLDAGDAGFIGEHIDGLVRAGEGGVWIGEGGAGGGGVVRSLF